MTYFRYCVLAAASWCLCVIGAVILLPLLVCVELTAYYAPLPKWARWFDNDIEPLGDYARKPAILAATGLKRVWLRYVWLGWRNPANNFGVVAAINRVESDKLELSGNQRVSDQGEQGKKFNRLMNGERMMAFEYYYVRVYRFFGARCLRVRLGWKLDDTPARLVCVINPLMPYTGAAHDTRTN